jgi:hypothetical protein
LRAFFNALPRLALFTLAGEHLNTTFLALAPTVLGADVHAQRTFVIDDEVGQSLGSLKERDLRDKLDGTLEGLPRAEFTDWIQCALQMDRG